MGYGLVNADAAVRRAFALATNPQLAGLFADNGYDYANTPAGPRRTAFQLRPAATLPAAEQIPAFPSANLGTLRGMSSAPDLLSPSVVSGVGGLATSSSRTTGGPTTQTPAGTLTAAAAALSPAGARPLRPGGTGRPVPGRPAEVRPHRRSGVRSYESRLRRGQQRPGAALDRIEPGLRHGRRPEPGVDPGKRR